MVTLIGSNGAGKSTTLRSISGLTPAERGDHHVRRRGHHARCPAHEIVARGIAHGARGPARLPADDRAREPGPGRPPPARAGIAEDLERVYSLFPRLKERERQKAGTMSGGEQQMLAIGRALMARPRLLMLDEPSLGLAPILVQRIYETIAEINRDGVDDPAGRAERQLRARRRGARLRAGDRAGRAGQRLRQPPRRPRGPEGVPGHMTILALIGAKGLYLLFVWLISAAAAAWLAERKGYGERLGLTFGLLLSVVGLLIVLLLPGRPGSRWKEEGPLPRRH